MTEKRRPQRKQHGSKCYAMPYVLEAYSVAAQAGRPLSIRQAQDWIQERFGATPSVESVQFCCKELTARGVFEQGQRSRFYRVAGSGPSSRVDRMLALLTDIAQAGLALPAPLRERIQSELAIGPEGPVRGRAISLKSLKQTLEALV